MRRALVTGATGFIGSLLVRALCEQGWTVRALVRDPARGSDLPHGGVQLFAGDLSDPASLVGIATGVDVIFHAAAQLNVRGVSTEQYMRANLEGTQNLVAAIPAGSIGRFVQVSSIAAIGIRNTGTIDERYPCDPDLAYGKSKLAVDQLLQDEHRRRGFPTVILRPPTVYGPGERRNFLSLCRAILRRRFLLIGSGANRIDFCWAGNLVQAMVRAAERGRPGQSYLVADQPPLPFAETVEILYDLIHGGSPPSLSLPAPVAYAVSWPLAAIERWFGLEVPLTPGRVRTLCSDMCFDVRKARTELGFQPEGTFRQHARRTIAWYREKGLL